MPTKTKTPAKPAEPVFFKWSDHCNEMQEMTALQLIQSYLSETANPMEAFEYCNGEITLSDYRTLIEAHTQLRNIVKRGLEAAEAVNK